jgi:hypothetical protein
MVSKPQPVNQAVEKKYRDLIEKVLRSRNADAQLRVASGKPGVDLTIFVTPRNPRAASIELDIGDKDFVFMHIGQSTTFEIPSSGGVNLPVGQDEQIELLTSAVVEGKFEEKLMYSGEKLVSGRGLVHLPSKDVATSWKRVTVPFLKNKREHDIKYEPYV